ncbi:hypothetical protein [Neobacillus rhizophilus]|uniref:Uncharacterized protein n=1 Tax=Neobacillus rhizophilus TaxID=2833579 RepID=A0A942U5T3_9BACI|nr:hypothetical protein [Neobacillus rhizophilus]MBS4212972.1 hypothetical protein [Neobacillus rhizophilus]
MGAAAWQIISIAGYSLAAVLLIVAVFLFFKMNILAIIGDLSGRTAARQIEEIRERNKMTGSKRHQPDAFNLDRGSLTEPVGVRRLWTGRTGNTGKTGSTGRTGNTAGGTARPGDTVGRTGNMGNAAYSVVNTGNVVDTISPGFTSSTGNDRGNTVSTGDEFNTINTGFTGKVDRFFGNGPSDATEVLANDATEVLFQADKHLSEGTAVLSNETEVLLDSSTEVLYEGVETFEPGTEVLDPGTEVLNLGTEVLDGGTEVLIESNETTVLNPVVELDDKEDTPISEIEFKIIRDIKITHTDEVI